MLGLWGSDASSQPNNQTLQGAETKKMKDSTKFKDLSLHLGYNYSYLHCLIVLASIKRCNSFFYFNSTNGIVPKKVKTRSVYFGHISDNNLLDFSKKSLIKSWVEFLVGWGKRIWQHILVGKCGGLLYTSSKEHSYEVSSL